MTHRAEIVICGAGIAGVSAAYHLAKAGLKDIVLVDPIPPLSLTSDRSTECYRNWWPDPQMVALMNRSIDLMEELTAQTGNIFRMNRRGYLYVTGDAHLLDDFQQRAVQIADRGAGPLRVHTSAADYTAGEPPTPAQAVGADLLLDPAIIQQSFPYVTNKALAALHVRRAGWLSAQHLGAHLLECARALGVRLERAAVQAVDVTGGRVRSVTLGAGEHIDCANFIDAAGPYLKPVARLLGIDLPVQTELHLKLTFKDQLAVVARDAPLMIWNDPQSLPWAPDELDALREDAVTRWLVEPFPAGVHVRPEGSGENQTIMILWDYKERWMEPVFPPPLDDLYSEIALRGLSTMLPALSRYFDHTPRPYLDGGYYVKTPENRLLAGPLPIKGAFVLGGLSGFGIMSACAAGELLAAHVIGSALPAFAPAFSPLRYEAPHYQQELDNLDYSGQL